MRRWVRVLLWFAAFAGALGIGVFAGMHSNPFGPEVQGSSGPSIPPASSTPSLQRWRGVINSATSHDLYVGGSCTTDWKTTIRFTVDAGGSVKGDGTASREGDLSCSFENPQINADTYAVKVTGSYADGALTLRLTATSSSPSGTSDYGGFEHTLFAGARSVLTVDAFALKSRIDLQLPDAEARGTYLSSNVVKVSCLNCLGS